MTAGWVEIHRCAERRPLEELALVLRATGIEHRLRREDDAFVLDVPPQRAERAARELRAYAAENRGWPPTDVLPPVPRGAIPVALGAAALLLGFFLLERGRAFGLDWWGGGAGHAGRVQGGEWWRTVTALTLHVDLHHMAGNMVFGAVFGVLLAQLVGNGVAWASILASGALGNALAASLRSSDHRSVGASTAVFGALGVLAAFEWRRRGALRVRPLRRWSPPIMGLVLLGWLGMGGEGTDVLAHLAGIVAGAVLGLALGSRALCHPLGRAVQVPAGLLPLVLLGIAWWLALT